MAFKSAKGVFAFLKKTKTIKDSSTLECAQEISCCEEESSDKEWQLANGKKTSHEPSCQSRNSPCSEESEQEIPCSEEPSRQEEWQPPKKKKMSLSTSCDSRISSSSEESEKEDFSVKNSQVKRNGSHQEVKNILLQKKKKMSLSTSCDSRISSSSEESEQEDLCGEEQSCEEEWQPVKKKRQTALPTSCDSWNTSSVHKSCDEDATISASDDSMDSIEYSVQSVEIGPKRPASPKKSWVYVSSKKQSPKYKWDKKHSCKFCKKMVNKTSTHFQKVHSDEVEVAKILAMKKNCLERRRAFIALQDQGDYAHNVSVLEAKAGYLIPKYRTADSRAEKRLACRYCKGLFLKHIISVHTKRCSQKPSTARPLRKGESAQYGRLMLPVPVETSSDFYHHVLGKLKDDDIARIIRNDSLILEFGKRKFERRDIEEHTAGQINNRIRELGRLLRIIRKKSEMRVSTLSAVIDAAQFDLLLVAVRELAGFSADSHAFKKGHLARRLGNSLIRCAQIKKSEAIKKCGQGQDDIYVAEINAVERFETVFKGDWYDSISAAASQSVHRSSQNKPKLLPSCEDVEKVQTLLQEKIRSSDYATVTKATLCLISIFSRKRGGELQRMKIAEFQQSLKNGPTTNQDLLKGLSETEKKMVSHFHRVEIRGKFNRLVPILLTGKMIRSVKKVLMLRGEIPGLQHPEKGKTDYLFQTPTGKRPYRGNDALREYASEAKVQNSSFFTFTNLRKQLATLSQAMEISKLDQDQLADFLGHDIRIHRHIYRLPQEILQKAKVARILLSINKGMIDAEQCLKEELEDAEIDCDEENEDKSSEDKQKLHDDDCDVADNSDGEEDRHSDVQEPCFSQHHLPAQSHQTEITSAATPENKREMYHWKQKRKQRKWQPWSEAEKKAVERQLQGCFLLHKLPGKNEIEHAIAMEPSLRNRKWTNIKDYVRNILEKTRDKN